MLRLSKHVNFYTVLNDDRMGKKTKPTEYIKAKGGVSKTPAGSAGVQPASSLERRSSDRL